MAPNQFVPLILPVGARPTLITVVAAVGAIATQLGPHLEQAGNLLRENGPALSAWARRHAAS